MPNEIKIPKKTYDSLDLKFPHILLNRDPSISTRSVYVCTVKPHDDPTDSSIKLNQFILRPLNGDQDGDDVNGYYIQKDKSVDNYIMTMAKYEILRKSYDFGERHDMFANPRYGFSQQQDLILHQFHKELCQKNKLWNSLDIFSESKRKRVFWALACFTHRDETDEFLRMFLVFSRKAASRLGLVTIQDLETGGGILKAVVESGAKGSDLHIHTYKEQLSGIPKAVFLKDAISSFDKFVESNKEMKKDGKFSFFTY